MSFLPALTIIGVVVGSLALIGVGILAVYIVQLYQNCGSNVTNLSSCRTTIPSSTPDEIPQTPDAPDDTSESPLYTLQTITVDGVDRTYYMSTPPKNGTKLLLWFHGTGVITEENSLFDSILDEYQVIQPIGLMSEANLNSWQSVPGSSCNSDADDMAFVSALLTLYNLSETYCGGFSVGSGFVARLSVDASMAALIDGFMMCSSGIQEGDVSNITSNDAKPNIFISNGDIDPISPVAGGAGDAGGGECYNFSSLTEVISKWASKLCGLNSPSSTDPAGNQIYDTSCGSNRVYGIVFKDTAHKSSSDSVTAWIQDQTGSTDGNLMTTALRILDGTASI